MNTLSIDFRPFVEWDNSPFVLYDNQGKILYLNNSAEILFGYVASKEIFDIAINNAPQTFGYKTTPVTLNYNAFSFYAVTVGYENEKEISIRLYNTPRIKINSTIKSEKLIETDINVLLEANIALFKTKNSNKLRLITDQEIPTFKIDQNNFSKLLRKSLDAFRASDSIHIELKLHLGEHIIIDNKKEKVIQLVIRANGRYADNDNKIRNLAEICHTIPLLEEHSITLEIPLIS